MTPPRAGRLAAALIVASMAVTSAFVATAAASAVAANPHIVAKPNNLMVNTDTHLIGSGWPANTTLQINECSQKTWIAPQDPCATGNVVTVTTDSTGHFKTELTAEVCPGTSGPGGRGFAELCYVGVPHPVGVDEVKLIGAAKITVTGP